MDYEHCIYCGDWFQCRDHIIPISYCQTYRDYKRGATVYCCKECNTLLGDRAHFSISSRAEYLIEAYWVKRRKFLTFPEWTADEIMRLGYNLRDGIARKMATKRIYLKKLENLELVSQGFNCHSFWADGSVNRDGLVDLETLTYNPNLFIKNCLVCGELFVTNKEKRLLCSRICSLAKSRKS